MAPVRASSGGLAAWALLVGGALAFGCIRPELPTAPSVERGPCDDFDIDVQRFWSGSTRAEVRGSLNAGAVEASVVERVVTRMDDICRDWVMAQESVCKDTVVRKITSPEVYAKVTRCMRAALVSQRTLVEAMRSPSKEQVLKLDEAIRDIGRENSECQREAIYSAYEPREADRVAVVAAREGTATSARPAASHDETLDLDVAQQALAEARALGKIPHRARWAEALQRGIPAARRSRDPRVLVDLLLSDAERLDHAEAQYDAALGEIGEAQDLAARAGYEEGLAASDQRAGSVYFNQRKYPLALESFGKALAIRKRILGDHPDTARSELGIANVYTAEHQYDAALGEYRSSVAITEKVLGVDHPETARGYGSIGNVYSEQGKYADALEWYQKALAILEKVAGKNHPDTATAYSSLGNWCVRQGKYAEALEWYEKALAIQSVVLAKDHPVTASTRAAIGSTYSSLGKYPEALDWYRQALAATEELGKDRPDTALIYRAIGRVYHQQQAYPEAMDWYAKALAIQEKVLGEDDPETKESWGGMARGCDAIGSKFRDEEKFAEATDWYQKALAIQERVYGTENADTARTYNDLAVSYGMQHRYPESLAWYRKAFAIREKVLGEGAIDTAVSEYGIGHVYDDEGNYPEALEWYRKALVTFERSGKDDSDAAVTHNNISVMCSHGNYEPACEVARQNPLRNPGALPPGTGGCAGCTTSTATAKATPMLGLLLTGVAVWRGVKRRRGQCFGPEGPTGAWGPMGPPADGMKSGRPSWPRSTQP